MRKFNVTVNGTVYEVEVEEVEEGAASAAPVSAPKAAPKTAPKAEAPAPKAEFKSDANPVIMPRQGNTVESCVISNWNVKVGDTVKKGDILFTYETDKATFDAESEFEGTVLAIFYGDGDDVPCLNNVCVIGKPGDPFEGFDPNAAAAPAATAPAAPEHQSSTAHSTQSQHSAMQQTEQADRGRKDERQRKPRKKKS